MGAYCSIHNDTSDETVMVYVGVNTKVLQPILWSITGLATVLSGGVALGSVPGLVSLRVASDLTLVVSMSTLTAAAGGLVSASNFILDQLQTQLVNDLTKGGYTKCLPGQTYTTPKLSPALNLRAWLVRIQKTPQAIIIKRSDASVWSAPKPGQQLVYRVLDKRIFTSWTNHETIPIQFQNVPTEVIEEQQHDNEEKKEEDDAFTLLESGMANCQCKLVETTTTSSQEGDTDVDEDQDAWIQVDAVVASSAAPSKTQSNQ